MSSRRKHSDFKETVDTMSERFSELINYCESTKFRGFECPKRYWEMSSLDETKEIEGPETLRHTKSKLRDVSSQ